MVLRRIPLHEGVPGSLPPIADLVRLTGQLDFMALGMIVENEGPPPKILATFQPMNDDEIVMMMLTMIWIQRGRNGLLDNGQTCG